MASEHSDRAMGSVRLFLRRRVTDFDEWRSRFERNLPGVPFVIVESPYRSLVAPFVSYLDVTFDDPESIVLVIIPEYVAKHWWERLLYNQTARRLRQALLGRPSTVVANVPYRPTPRPKPTRSSIDHGT